MIKSSNIIKYIQFLYQQRFKTDASPEVLDSWKDLPDEQIDGYLKELYQHWNLSPEEGINLEQEFLKTSGVDYASTQSVFPGKKVKSQPEIKQNPIQFNPPKKEKAHFSKILIIVLIVTLLCIIAFLSYQLLNKENEESLPVPHVSTEGVVAPNNDPSSAAGSDLPSISENANSVSTENAMVIKRLFDAEMSRDMETILNQFAPYVERYWAINYPTTEELSELYEQNWMKTKDMRYENIKITQVNDSTIDATATYSYQDLEKGKPFKRNIVNRYIFNENHQIVQAYSL